MGILPPAPAVQWGAGPGAPSRLFSSQNWFRTSADPPPKHRNQDALATKKEEKRLAGGKKRGRKPKERTPEEPAPKMSPCQDDWPSGGRDKGARGSAGRKVGAGKAPEK